MTSVRPLSCREESSDGSWNTNTVTTSVAVKVKDRRENQVKKANKQQASRKFAKKETTH